MRLSVPIDFSWRQLVGEADGFDAVAGLADHVEAGIGHGAAETLTQHPVVVGEHQADGHQLPPFLCGTRCGW